MILALDYGERRIGVAVTDTEMRFAKALDFIPNKSGLQRVTMSKAPKGTTPEALQELRKNNKKEAKIELLKVFNKLLYLINCYYPDKLLVGIPTTVDENGNPTEGKQAKIIKTFLKKFEIFLKQKNIVMDVVLIDESMTSTLVEQKMRLKGMRSTNIRKKIDSESARMLLEEYLNKNV